MPKSKYRATITRSTKKKKPPGRKRKEQTVDMDGGSTTVEESTTEVDEQERSTCSKKFKITRKQADEIKTQPPPDNLLMLWSYLLIDTRVFNDIIETIGSCPDCSSKVNLVHNMDAKNGLAHLLELSCLECDWTKSFWTSMKVDKNIDGCKTRGKSGFDINTRSVIAMREIGKGHTALKTLCGYMNISPPMTPKTFSDIQDNNVIPSYIKASEINMKSAADELRSGNKDEIINTIISTDGSWQRRGFSSLNGLVTVIANDIGKCIDYRVKTKNCHACKLWKGKKWPKADKFHKYHKCPLNHTGSSGMMESNGILECFESSVEKRQLRYLTYIGDGDTKSYQNVVAADPYPGYPIKKAECVGHVQKRVGKRLRNFKSNNKELMPKDYYVNKKDKKPKRFAFYLTNKYINQLQNYYGIAIRSNKNTSVSDMRKAVGAVLYHCSDANNLESRHQFCPLSATSWCKYKVDQVNGTNNYVEKPGLPIPLRKKLEPIFRELSTPELLERCLHGNTQNSNESLNGLIWARCPKTIFVSRSVLEMSVSSAILIFNSGKRGLFDVFTNCGLEIGSYTETFCYLEDASKVIRLNIKSTKAVKKRRKTLRSVKMGFVDKEAEEEPSYASGAYN